MSHDTTLTTASNFSSHSYDQVNISGGSVVVGNYYPTVNLYVKRPKEDPIRKRIRRVVESIAFPGLRARLNAIKDAQYNTYEWALSAGDNLDNPWDCLATWLRRDEKFFLVQGKAGSGKSTFMKFVFKHEKTRTYLGHWTNGTEVMAIFHSFWYAGTPLQRNLKGFFASLIVQLLQSTPDGRIHRAALILDNEEEEPYQKTLDDWSVQELEEFLLQILKKGNIPTCIFIDGMDEYDFDADLELKIYLVLGNISRATKAKFCIATRPIKPILDHFTDCPGLRLQDLTKSDIYLYTRHTLLKRTQCSRDDAKQRKILGAIEDEICSKADGVFLWVWYVLQNVCRGLSIHDDLRALQKRIAALPSDIEQLFELMWKRQNLDNAVHARESTQLFMFGKFLPMPLFHLVIANNPNLRQQYLDRMTMNNSQVIAKLCENFAEHLTIRTAGLIECVESHDEENDEVWGGEELGWITSTSAPWRELKVHYMHRTVKDFLEGTSEGQRISGRTQDPSLSPSSTCRSFLDSWLVCYIQFVRELSISSLKDMLENARTLTEEDEDFVFLMDRVLQHITQLQDRKSSLNNGWRSSLQSSCYPCPSSWRKLSLSEMFEECKLPIKWIYAARSIDIKHNKQLDSNAPKRKAATRIEKNKSFRKRVKER